MPHEALRTPEDLFEGHADSLALCREVQRVLAGIGPTTASTGKSQVALRRRRALAYLWRPGQYVRSDVPAVLTLAMPREIVSDRFKSVVHPSPGVWMHHLELRDASDVDEDVRRWLAEAWMAAG